MKKKLLHLDKKGSLHKYALPALSLILTLSGGIFAVNSSSLTNNIQLNTVQPSSNQVKTAQTGSIVGESDNILNEIVDLNNALSDEKIESLILDNENLVQVLNLLEQLTGKVVLLSKNLPKINISLRFDAPTPKIDVINAIESLLAMNGVAITEMGEKFLNAVPSNRVKSSAAKIVNREDLDSIKETKTYMQCAFDFNGNNLNASEASRLVTPLITPNIGSVVTSNRGKTIWITDTLSNLRIFDSMFKKVKNNLSKKDEILFFKLKYSNAKDVQAKLKNLKNGALKRNLYGNTTFDYDTHTNQLIVVAPKDNLPEIEACIKQLDVAVSPYTKSKVIQIQHGSSKEITELIKKIMQSQHKNGKDNDISKEDSAVDENSASKFSSSMSVESDDRSNAVVVWGTPTDIKQIEDLISQIDVVLPQVRIEVIIAEVTLKAGQASGLESFGINYAGLNKDGKTVHQLENITSASAGTFVTNPIGITSLGLRKFSIAGAINAAKKNKNIAILSSPTIMTTHNKEAVVEVSESRPFVKKTSSDTSSSNQNAYNNEISQEEAGIVLKVKPLIGGDGVVQMEITQKVDSFNLETKTELGSISMPAINKRKAESFVTVKDKEVIVLAGLKQREKTRSKSKMFLLGEIPVLGGLFTGKGTEEITKELVIFIRPHIVKNELDVKSETQKVVDNLSDYTKDHTQYYMENNKFKGKDLSAVFEEDDNKPKRRFKKKPVLKNRRKKRSSSGAEDKVSLTGTKRSKRLFKTRQESKKRFRSRET